MTHTSDPLLALADFLVEDLMATPDEEILSECTPAEIEEAKLSIQRAVSSAKQTQGV